MAGIDNIINTILSDARAEEQEILAAAAERAAQMAAAEEAAGRETCEALRAASRETVETAVRRIESSARMDIRKAALSRRMEAIERVFVRAAQGLEELPQEQYEKLVYRLALENASGGEALVLSEKDTRFTPQLLEKINDALSAAGKEPLSIAGARGAFSGGFMLSGGGVEINCTFEALLRYYREQLLKDVADRLFAGEA